MTLPPRTAAYAFTSSAAATVVLCALAAYTGPQNLGEVLLDCPPILSVPLALGAAALGVRIHAAVGPARFCANVVLFVCAAWCWQAS